MTTRTIKTDINNIELKIDTCYPFDTPKEKRLCPDILTPKEKKIVPYDPLHPISRDRGTHGFFLSLIHHDCNLTHAWRSQV